jgi:hypothetical protein
MMKSNVQASGAFFGRHVDIGEFTHVEHFPGIELHHVQCTIPYCNINAVAGGSIHWDCNNSMPLPNGTACDDGNACTEGDACDGEGFCISGDVVPDPNPDNDLPCKRDECDPALGIYEPDGTLCSESESCHEPTQCDMTGHCVVLGPDLPNGTPCDDGIPNNGEDTCTNGNCYGSLGPYDCLANNCSEVPGAPPDLECWLTEHPSIATVIRWLFPIETGGSTFIMWKDWEAWRKQELQQAFEDAWAWYDNGMTTFPGTFIPEPPPNCEAETLGDNDYPMTVFDETAVAWPMYLAHLAHILMVEIRGLVP